MVHTVLRGFLRNAPSRHESSRGSAARRRLTRRPELDLLEVRLTPSGAVNYTNLAVSGAVVVPPPSPVHDVKIAFSATPGSSFTLNEDAHDVTIVGNIPAGDTVTLNGNVNNVTIQGNVLGTFDMNKNGNDVRMGDVHRTVTIGPSSATIIHDFTAGEIFAGAHFTVFDTFHDGTLGPEDAGSTVVITGPHHRLTIRS
jgi:hypothetical protein